MQKRVTSKLLIKLVNEMFKRHEMNFICYKIIRTRFTANQYCNGAHFWRAYFCSPGEIEDNSNYFMSFDQYSQLQAHIDSGKELLITLQTDRTEGYILSYNYK